jgi:hypothetical protein
MRRRLLQCAAVVAVAGTLAAPASATVITLGASREATIFENNVDNRNGAISSSLLGLTGRMPSAAAVTRPVSYTGGNPRLAAP